LGPPVLLGSNGGVTPSTINPDISWTWPTWDWRWGVQADVDVVIWIRI
jgi:hypothetical protein